MAVGIGAASVREIDAINIYHATHLAMRRAIGLWYDYPQDFRYLMLNGMRYDYSWNHPGRHYVNIYDYIRHK